MDPIEIIFTIIPLLPIPFLYHQREKHHCYYSTTWKLSKYLKPEDLLGERLFKIYYEKRDFDDQIKTALKEHRNILIIGKPLAGKTRAIYESLNKSDESFDILIPKCLEIDPDNFVFPLRARFWRQGIVILDDLPRFVEKRGFEILMREIIARHFMIIASSRTGSEYQNIENKFASFGIHLNSIFNENIVKIPDFDEETARKVALNTGIDWTNVQRRFNGTIGSIFMKLDEMQSRFNTLPDGERNLLLSLKKLYNCGIYDERGTFLIKWIRKIVARNEIYCNKSIEYLEKKEFIKVSKETIVIEPVYIEDIITSTPEINNRVQCLNFSKIFYDDPQVLMKMGDRLLDIRSFFKDQDFFLKNAIQMYQTALDNFSKTTNLSESAQIKRNLGMAYRNLAEFEDKAVNCYRAIDSFLDALKVFTVKKSPFYYSTIKNDLGVAYGTLADVENKSENCKRAITAFNESLLTRPIDSSPEYYARTHNNLGNAYWALSNIEDRSTNYKRAISEFDEALKVFTIESAPMEYATTHNNLGNAYLDLADVEEKSANCKRAIAEHTESLRVFTIDLFPLDFALTQNNIGQAYSTLSDVENTSKNSKNAIKALNDSLKIYTIDKTPYHYAMVQNNLGTAYWSLSKIEDKSENSRRAITAFVESLKIYTIEQFPMDFAMIQNNLGIVFGNLATLEHKRDNCDKALKAFNEALKIYTIDKFPIQNLEVNNNRLASLMTCEKYHE